MLRDYQQRAITALYEWFRNNAYGNPVLELPTGAGKSHIVAQLCRDIMAENPSARVLMLTHVKELIEQNAGKLRDAWPNAPMGIFSAGLGRKDIDAITFAGIQSIYRHAKRLGHVHLVVIDECHLVNNNRDGRYRKLLDALTEINPDLRVVGLTATPYRLGQGMLDQGEDALFSDIISVVSISELVAKGYLSPLRSKLPPKGQIDLLGVGKVAGEFNQRELEAAARLSEIEAVEAIIQYSGGRGSWLIFCTGVDHSEEVASALRQRGVSAASITQNTPKDKRAELIAEFKAGRIQALTNCNVLTTGFDHPGIDLIAFLRATMSAGLYMQMAGRGMRIAEGKTDCLVLDFAGNIERHGPVTNVKPSKRSRREDGIEGDSPVKACPECHELVLISEMTCPACGHVWPEKEREWQLADDDIMGANSTRVVKVADWAWREHIAKKSGNYMVKVTYYPSALSEIPVTEYLAILNQGYAGEKAQQRLLSLFERSGAERWSNALPELCDILNQAQPPAAIKVEKQGKWDRVIGTEW
jgi:DNA repair protein RadD